MDSAGKCVCKYTDTLSYIPGPAFITIKSVKLCELLEEFFLQSWRQKTVPTQEDSTITGKRWINLYLTDHVQFSKWGRKWSLFPDYEFKTEVLNHWIKCEGSASLLKTNKNSMETQFSEMKISIIILRKLLIDQTWKENL